MNPSPADIAQLVRRRLSALGKADPSFALPLARAEAERELTRIILGNFESGRFESFKKYRQTKPPLTRLRYTDDLIQVWLREAPFWYQLRKGESAAWRAERLKLTRAAAGMLHRLGPRAAETAEDYAERACMRLLQAEYPFDIPFDAWAFKILQNEIRDRRARKDALTHATLSLDEPGIPSADGSETIGESQFASPAAQLPLDGLEDRDLILRVLEQLNSVRRAVIVLSFFEELSDDEIARRLETPRANVQTLRHRALDQMSELLRGEGLSVKRRRRHQNRQGGV